MTQLTDDCFAFGGKLMTMADALTVLNERVVPVAEIDDVALADARGRVLAEDVASAVDVPQHDNAAVDGYALRFADLQSDAETRLAVRARAAAGHPAEIAVGQAEAARIFTGAVMPEGADTVIMQEDVSRDGDYVLVPPGLKIGANRRKAGEDIARGSLVLQRGHRLRPQDLGVLAAIGRDRLRLYRRLRVAAFSTGDELQEPGQPLRPGGVFDSNRRILIALLQNLGCEVSDLGILADSADDVRNALAAAADRHDLLITSGGMSTGEEDHVKTVVEALGNLHFWRLAIKPGRPLALGQVGRTPIVGLPGNPVAVMVTFVAMVRPMILRLMGGEAPPPHSFKVCAGFAHKKKKDRREWLRVRLEGEGPGTWRARKFPREGAGILSSLVEADGLVELPEDLTRLAPGTMVDFLPFSEVTQ